MQMILIGLNSISKLIKKINWKYFKFTQILHYRNLKRTKFVENIREIQKNLDQEII